LPGNHIAAARRKRPSSHGWTEAGTAARAAAFSLRQFEERNMARAGHKGMQPKRGVEHVGDTPPEAIDQDDFAEEMKGRNSLQGSDQQRVHNQRRRMAGEKRETEGLIESFENVDPKARAGR
jgi:hypothetical protein